MYFKNLIFHTHYSLALDREQNCLLYCMNKTQATRERDLTSIGIPGKMKVKLKKKEFLYFTEANILFVDQHVLHFLLEFYEI